MTPKEKRIIELISNYPNKLNSLTLSKRANMTYVQAIKITQKFIKNGLMKRERFDKREYRFSLTEKGQNLLE